MQVSLKTHIQKYLIISLLAIIIMWAIGYALGQKAAIISSDFAYLPLTTVLTITAFFQVYQIRKERKNIFAWYAFAAFALTYSIAQHIWSLNEIILDTKPFPSFADVAFIISNISIIIFFILTIKSKKQFISRWMYVVAIPSGCFVTVLSSYFFMVNNTESTLGGIMSLAYPVLDSIALMPAVIGIILYFKDKANFAIFLICFSMIPLTTGDILFQITTSSGTYYSGFIPDLFYYIQITLLIFGVYIISNHKININVGTNQN